MSRLFAPWRSPAQLLRYLGFVVLGLPMGVIAVTMVSTLFSVSLGMIAVVLIGLPLLMVTMRVTHQFARLERSRVAAADGTIFADPVRPLAARGWFGRFKEMLGSGARWREVAYAAVLVVPASLGFTLVVAAWAGSFTLLLLPWVIHRFPGEVAHFYLFDADRSGALRLQSVGVLGLVLVAPWVTALVARLEIAMAGSLLGPTGGDLAARVEAAEATRVAAVDSAEAERRRIERDLHDGAQQRLVALAANLGAARERLAADPEGAGELVASAHEEAKGALREIRDLVRGIHPVILEDRGLPAALSAIVARCPIPVQLDVALAGRLPAAVESTAYFVVSEALTNVARHSQAARAWVSIARTADRVVVEVRDDGVGGADASTGTGLQGLRDRVAAIKGTMFVISPIGGPTTISVELPCAS